MRKRNKINVWREDPCKDNANAYFAKTIALYQSGDYEAALKGFEKLSEFIDTDLKIVVIPHIEKCKRVIEKNVGFSSERLLEALKRGVFDFARGASQHDDITLVILGDKEG